mmetsp:Transcript_8412/g.24041  ORF Transcript_8412/g.24041 Transcript_8412/m.24041 type:complete len:201 (-) Transcript_8412:609-1211(-)
MAQALLEIVFGALELLVSRGQLLTDIVVAHLLLLKPVLRVGLALRCPDQVRRLLLQLLQGLFELLVDLFDLLLFGGQLALQLLLLVVLVPDARSGHLRLPDGHLPHMAQDVLQHLLVDVLGMAGLWLRARQLLVRSAPSAGHRRRRRRRPWEGRRGAGGQRGVRRPAARALLRRRWHDGRPRGGRCRRHHRDGARRHGPR